MTTQNLAPVIKGIFSNRQTIPRDPNIIDLKDSFVFDFTTGDFQLNGGQLVLASQEENAKMWIRKTLITEQGVFPVYTQGYGSALNSLIGKGYIVELLEVMFPDIIRNAIGGDSRIRTIDKFVISVSDNALTASFRVRLVNEGNINLEQAWVIG